jgi:hypothetical protein
MLKYVIFILISLIYSFDKIPILKKHNNFNKIAFLDSVNNFRNYTQNEIFNGSYCDLINLPNYVKNQFDLELYVHNFMTYDFKYFSLSTLKNIIKYKRGACMDYTVLFFHGFKCLQQKNLLNKNDKVYFIGGYYLPQSFKIEYLRASHAWNFIVSNNRIYFYDATNNGTFISNNKTIHYLDFYRSYIFYTFYFNYVYN